MEIITINNCPNSHITLGSQGRRFHGFSPRSSPSKEHNDFASNLKVFASRKSVKTVRKWEEPKSKTLQTNRNSSNKHGGLVDRSSEESSLISNDNDDSLSDNLDVKSLTQSPSRGDVLQACTITSGMILGLGVAIRQVFHIALEEGWVVLDDSTKISFDFEASHLQLIVGLVILVSSCRYLLLMVWPDFAESSEAANQQVLGPLQPVDYAVVAFLPGISEELLFRGALLPLFGLSWEGALAVGAIFGALHLGSGRRYSFAVWATFVGFAYGLATIMSSSVIVPMASHSLNNLVGGIL